VFLAQAQYVILLNPQHHLLHPSPLPITNPYPDPTISSLSSTIEILTMVKELNGLLPLLR
jgi:hypothetical protein